jgi:hypothetical protein
MTARSAPLFRERQTSASTASMPNARPWRRGQAPKPHGGAPKAQGLTAAIAVAAPSSAPSFVPDDPVASIPPTLTLPMNIFVTSRIHTSLTGTTFSADQPNHRRLQQIKAKHDPDNLFRLNQNIQPMP